MLVMLSAFIALRAQAQDSAGYWKAAYDSANSQYRFSEALHHAEKWATHDSLNPTAFYELAKTCAQKGKDRCTARAFDRLFQLDSAHIGGLNLQAKVQLAAGDDAAARATYERLMAADSTNPYYFKKAAVLAANDKRDPWRSYLYFKKALKLDSNDVSTYIDYAQWEMERRAYYPADILLKKALELDSASQAARVLAAKSAHVQDDPNDVIRLLKNRSFDPAYMPAAARYYGISQYKTGDYEGAIETLALLSFALPDADYPHYYAGLCHKALGDHQAALAQFDFAIEKATSPNLASYYDMLGQSYQAMDLHGQAITQLRQAKFLGADGEINYHLAISYDAYYADQTIALKAFQEFLSQDSTIDPRTTYARQRLDQLKKEAHFQEK